MVKKRLIVACDGTWVDADNGFVRNSWLPWKTGGQLATPSNVTRICRALRPESDQGVSQVVYYQAGLGSANNAYSFYIGGYLGEGISENIREAYAFLCSNYGDGDEIFLIGFSRGAFTARSVGGLIGEIGLLTRKGLSSFYPIFKDWENQMDPKYTPQYGTALWPVTRPKFRDPIYKSQLVEKGLTRPSIPIKAVGVWDTVGSLGIPELTVLPWLFGGLKLFSSDRHEYSFIDSMVPSNVEHAYQALALDEERKPFSPTVWESPKLGEATKLKLLKQCWFPGVHTSVGGGYHDTSISDITLAWMVTQLSRHLTFDPDYILLQQRQNEKFYIDHNVPVARWALGSIPRSDIGLLNTLAGKQVRTPGSYHVTDPATGKVTRTLLQDTREFMHPSVRYRISQKGPGLVNSPKDRATTTYEPKALAGWTFAAPGESWRDDKALGISKDAEQWDDYGKWLVKGKDGKATYLVEETIKRETDEIQLLNAWPGVAEKVLD